MSLLKFIWSIIYNNWLVVRCLNLENKLKAIFILRTRNNAYNFRLKKIWFAIRKKDLNKWIITLIKLLVINLFIKYKSKIKLLKSLIVFSEKFKKINIWTN